MVIGIGLYLIFLDSTESDVLLNFSGGGLASIVGRLASDIITYCVLLGYAMNLMITYPMINWGLREVPPCLLLCIRASYKRVSMLLREGHRPVLLRGSLFCACQLPSQEPSSSLTAWAYLRRRAGIAFSDLIVRMQVIAEVIVGQPDVGNVAWIGITAVIVGATYAMAVAVPNIWPVMVRCAQVLLCRLRRASGHCRTAACTSHPPFCNIPMD